ncbi:hypothetical protein EUX98_g8115 [Antrodiella citrinella]|uniref:Uncharacterized protein n=1 Tax=Antrodiella citrinella TaxID=2447956 RepID=A0A4V3XGX5_9APHY|nr:hypothetical protein EUX98_g8115 [Antrodiella citrinella]
MTSRSGMSKHPDYKISLGLLQENWRQLIEVYQQLVWDSRELAGEAQALATDFVQIFWPRFLDSNVHLSIKLVELRDYARGIEDQAVHSKRVRSAFTTLTERVAACQIDYSSLAPEYNLSLKHQDLRNRFKWILNEIEPPRDEIFEGKGAFFVVRSLAPMLQRENVVPLYLMDNDSVYDAHSVLSTKILAIASISTAIRVDFQRLSTHIDDKSKHIDVDENGSFQHDLHYDLLRIKTFYEALVKALKDYQVNVVSPNAEV